MKILVPVKRVIDYNVRPAREGGRQRGRSRQRQDEHEPVRRDRRRRGDPAEGKGRGGRDRRGLDRPGQGAGNAAHRARHGRRPGDPGRDRRRGRAARGGQDPQGDRRRGSSPASSCSASRRSTTTATRPARCSPRCWAARRAPSPARSRSTATASPSPAKSTAVSRRSTLNAAGGGHHRPAPQRAALCLAAQHHEGQVQAARYQEPGRLRRRHDAAPQR